MRKILILLIALQAALQGEIKEKIVEFDIGYRRDFLNWSFEDPSINTEIIGLMEGKDETFGGGISAAILCANDLFQSSWKDLRFINLGGSGIVTTYNCLYTRISGNWAYLVEGRYHSEGAYGGQYKNIHSVLLECTHRNVRGSSWDVSGALGGEIEGCEGDFKFAPLLGYAHNAFQARAPDSITYKNYFTGPFIGFDAYYNVDNHVSLFTAFEYHFVRYKAHARICRTEEHSAHFDQEAFARGLFCSAGLGYYFSNCWSAGIKFFWRDWRAFKHGRIRTDVRNGEEERYNKDATLNGVQWGTYCLEATFGRAF